MTQLIPSTTILKRSRATTTVDTPHAALAPSCDTDANTSTSGGAARVFFTLHDAAARTTAPRCSDGKLSCRGRCHSWPSRTC
jgi:hypothetical protein